MSSKAFDRNSASSTDRPSPTRRRSVLLGAGVAGAAAFAAKTLPIAPEPEPPAPAQPKPDEQTGYRLSQHVLRYYETTKV